LKKLDENCDQKGILTTKKSKFEYIKLKKSEVKKIKH